MTDTPTTAPEPVTSAPAADAPIDWQAKFQQEVDHRERERRLYRPVARIIDGLHEDDRTALVDLAEAIRTGDKETIVAWSLGAAEQVAGKPVADLIAERQAAQGAGPTDISSRAAAEQAPAALTAEQVQAAMREAIAAEREAADRKAREQVLIQSYTSKLSEAGLSPATPEGREVIEMCRAFQGDMDRAIKVYRASRAAEATGALGAAAAAGQVPPPAPYGNAPASAPAEGMTPRDRVMARLASKRT